MREGGEGDVREGEEVKGWGGGRRGEMEAGKERRGEGNPSSFRGKGSLQSVLK